LRKEYLEGKRAMVSSMTSFARQQVQADWGVLTWEIKSVNHRFLETSFRLPEIFRCQEMRLREALRDKLQRGKVECHVKYSPGVESHNSVMVNHPLIDALHDASEIIAKRCNVKNNVSVAELLTWPGSVTLNATANEEAIKAFHESFSKAVDKLIAGRKKEGAKLKEFLLERSTTLKTLHQQAKEITTDVVQKSREKLMNRVQELKVVVDNERFEQEVVLLVQRLDVSEELDRLALHCDELERVLSKETVLGRRLDFLMQEFNREANTLASKSNANGLTKLAVEMKVLIEQMREQIQNIE